MFTVGKDACLFMYTYIRTSKFKCICLDVCMYINKTVLELSEKVVNIQMYLCVYACFSIHVHTYHTYACTFCSIKFALFIHAYVCMQLPKKNPAHLAFYNDSFCLYAHFVYMHQHTYILFMWHLYVCMYLTICLYV